MKTCLVALVVALSACSRPTELLVVLSTDYPDGAYDQIELDVRDSSSDAATFSRTYLIPSEASLPASIELRPGGGDPTLEIDATLFAKGTKLVSRRAILPFVAHRALELRLALTQSCATVENTCSPEQTCVDGACVSPQVDPSTLPSISKDPLAPVDVASVHDLAQPSVDLPVRDMTLGDMASTPDLAGCPSLPPVPSLATNCTLVQFGPNTDPSIVHYPSDGSVMVSKTTCGDRWVITMAAGSHAYPDDFFIEPVSTMQSGNYTISAGYSAVNQGNALAGVRAVDSDAQWIEFGTTQATGVIADDDWQIYTLLSNQAPILQDQGDTNTAPKHMISMSRSTMATTAYPSYTFDVTASNPKPDGRAVGLDTAQTPMFFMNNAADPSSPNDDDAITVQLGWIQLCRN